jgi:endonuclease/exonuclease/phosphatase family metal-dependent hydrolase
MLSIMSYNLLYDDPRWGEEYRWVKRSAGVLELVRRYAPDVLGAQELTADSYCELREVLPEYGGTVPAIAPRSNEPEPWVFNATLLRRDRLELLEEEILWLSAADMRSRHAVCCLLRDRRDGQRFRHVNTHFPVDETARRRVGEDFFARCAARAGTLPQVIGGDFNTAGLGAEAGACGYTDTRHAGRSKGPDGSKIDRETHRMIPGSTIDHLFVSRNIEVVEFRTIDDRMDGRYPSDHLPVLAVVRLPA